MEKFRWAYVGSGSIAKNTARSITAGNHSITAVYSRNAAKAAEFAEKYGAHVFESFDEMLKDGCFDAVYIATPHTSHAEYSVRAMKAGKPVLCEKPAGVSVKEVDMMIEESRKNGVYFCEAMWTWFSDVAVTVKKRLGEGVIGEIKSVDIEYGFPGVLMSRNSRVRMPETAGGALLDIGIYPITYCYNLFGYPKEIKCKGTIKDGIDTGETIVLVYNGFECNLKLSLRKLKERCHITGTEGKINIPAFHMAPLAIIKAKGKSGNITGRTDYLTEFTRAAEEIKAGKTESEYIPLNTTRDCMKIMDECRRQMGLVYPFEKE